MFTLKCVHLLILISIILLCLLLFNRCNSNDGFSVGAQECPIDGVYDDGAGAGEEGAGEEGEAKKEEGEEDTEPCESGATRDAWGNCCLTGEEGLIASCCWKWP